MTVIISLFLTVTLTQIFILTHTDTYSLPYFNTTVIREDGPGISH